MERFWRRVEKTDTCWLWMGSCNRGGYGQFTYRGKNCRAHRVAWVLSGLGKLPAEKKLDHECNVRNCVRPGHLRPRSQRENVLRSATNPVAINARKTHCKYGHEFTPENTWFDPRPKHHGRTCRTCMRERPSRKSHQTHSKVRQSVVSDKYAGSIEKTGGPAGPGDGLAGRAVADGGD